MNKKGTRRANGEGSIYEIIQKIDRKNARLDFTCTICRDCIDRSICNNREGTKKCQKCRECTDCLKENFCDRFYCYQKNQAQITINGQHTTVANEKKKKDAVTKKLETEAKVQTKSYIRKNNITILELIQSAENRKKGFVKKNTYGRYQCEYNLIENSEINSIPFQKLTREKIEDFLDSKRYLSDSEINKIAYKIKIGCKEAIKKDICTEKNNPFNDVNIPLSLKDTKDIVPFKLEEFKKLVTYILTHDLVKNNKCNCDSDTIRNIILLTFLTVSRIGETLAYDYEEHINFEEEQLLIERTLSKDDDNKIIMGDNTKTGNEMKKNGYSDKRKIDFDIFCSSFVYLILEQQIKIASNNAKNKNKLLFCTKEGNYISPNSITNIFKRICREANVKLDLITGCHMHMTRHTGVTFLIEMGYDLYFISKITGHSDITQIQKTYGHILDEYMKKKLKNPKYRLLKKDIITPEIKELFLKTYK